MRYFRKTNWRINVLALLIAILVLFFEHQNANYFKCNNETYCKVYQKNKARQPKKIESFSLDGAKCKCIKNENLLFRLTRNRSYDLILYTKHKNFYVKNYTHYFDCQNAIEPFMNKLKSNEEVSGFAFY